MSDPQGKNSAPPAVVVLAAGKGTRMKSNLPKVLHRLAGKPMIAHVLAAIRGTGFGPTVVVVGHGADEVTEASKGAAEGLMFATQAEQLGTGHAVAQALPSIPQADQIVVVYGECPLVRSDMLTQLVERQNETGATVTISTAILDDPRGLGRIARNADGSVRAIVEEAVASLEEKAIREINGGLFCFDAQWLRETIPGLPLRPKGEYYLTDLIEAALSSGRKVETIPGDGLEIIGINDKSQLAESETILRARINRGQMLAGVTLIDPATTYIDADVLIGEETIVYPNTMLRGATRIGSGCEIGPNSDIRNSTVGDGCRVWASVLEDSTLERAVSVGPFSRLRGGAYVGADTYIGNYAEIKNTRIGPAAKVHHFSYLGDATVGRDANIGAGTITCNFNSETGEKSLTVIEDGAAIGSNTLLVAPVRIGAGAMTGSGSVVTHDVSAQTLALGVPAREVRPVNRTAIRDSATSLTPDADESAEAESGKRKES